MMPLANRPMMEHIVRLLREHGFDDIVVTVAFLANAIRNYFGDGSEFGVRMVYATEETPLGTAGSVRNAMDELDERFLVISGDVLTDIDLSAIVRFHEEGAPWPPSASRRWRTRSSSASSSPARTARSSASSRSRRGARSSATPSTPASTCSSPRSSTTSPPASRSTSPSDVFPALLEAGKPLFGYVAEGYWEDVGTLEAYVKAHQDVLDGKVEVEVPGFRLADGVWLGEGAEIHPDAKVEGPAVIGDNCRVEAGAQLREYTVLGANVRVGADAFLERAVVHDNAYLGPAPCACAAASSAARATCARGARCEEGVVLGDECFVGEHAVINPGVKVYPFKTVEAGRHHQLLDRVGVARRPPPLRPHGVAGLANVDITPELAVRAGDGLRHDAEEGLDRHDVARLEPGRPLLTSGR